FCYEGAAIDLKTSQGSPPSSGSVAFSGFGVADSGNGLAKFTPQTAFDAKDPNSTTAQTITVTAVYTNTQGCSYPLNRDFVVRVKPTSSFTVTDVVTSSPPSDFNFCYNDNSVILQGNQPASSTLKYTIDYLTLGYTKTINSDHFTFSPKTYYDDAVTKGGSNVSDANFNIKYIVSDAIGCTASTSTLFAVSPIATITISGINNGDKFCSNVKPFPITFAPINGTLDINGISTSLNPATNSINSVLLPIGNSVSISYTYKSGVSQCVSNTTYTVSKIEAPVASFTTSPVCDGQPASFSAAPNPTNYSWEWILGDSVRSGTDKENINQVFPGLSSGSTQTSYIIRLIVENNPSALLVCRDSAEAIQVIGAYPKVSFNNINVCESDFTRFSITNDIPIATAQWDFGDGYSLPIKPINGSIPAGTDGGRTTNKYGNPYHQFAFTSGQPNEYIVQLTARTADNLGACADTATKKVAILEKIAPTPIAPYTMANIHGGDGLWLTEDIADSSTWVFDNPVGKFDNTNGKVWITNASGNYRAKDNSYVNSPCFDLSAFNKPVLQLKYWNKTDLAKDGTVLQYSIDGGANWATLGSSLSGLNWYSSATISSAPGGFNQYGWTGQQQDSWLIGKNSLNEIPGGHSNVRFRIAFASDEREEYDGFAFNNVIIEERNRIALVEHFTNTGAPGSVASINNFLTDPAMNTSEVVRLEYHTNFPSEDVINTQNEQDNNARSAYYGISSGTVPIGFIDGTRNGTLGFQTNWFKVALAKRSLSSSPFEIDIATLPSAKPNQITVVSKITKIGLLGVVNPKPIMHVVIIEKSVGTDGFIMRKFLPSASGTAMITTPSIPTITKDTLTWNVEHVNDLSQLGIIVFIQDENTGEVYQSAMLENPTDLPTVITGTEMPLADQINVYPSPANKSVMIQLPKAVMENTPVKMFDVSGHEVHNSVFKTGEVRKTINSQDFAAGVYLIQIETAGTIVRKK
ncbi:MAG TPA: T9SS type A sorting domain-containing protein, partial [Cyclobacteriaceae bacterium]